MASANDSNASRMQVADVRKCLTQVRRAWDDHSPTTPVRLCAVLPNGMRVDEFCFTFVMWHHAKRHDKGKHAKS